MLIALHKNATTTPATRLALQQASGTDRELAQQYGIGVDNGATAPACMTPAIQHIGCKPPSMLRRKNL